MNKKIYLSILSLVLVFCSHVFAQGISNAYPSTGNVGDHIYVYISGSNTHFQQASGTNDVRLIQNSSSTTIVAEYLYPYGNAEVDAYFTIPFNAPIGDYDVVVSNSIDGTLSLTKGFKVTNNPPTITQVSPDNANVGETIDVYVIGEYTHFQQASGTNIVQLKLGSTGVPIMAQSIQALSATELYMNFSIPANAPLGFYDVTLSNSIDGTVTKQGAFEVTNDPASLTYIYPSTGNAGQTINSAINGKHTHFLNAGTNTIVLEKVGNPSITIAGKSVYPYNNTEVYVDFDIPNNATVGYYNVKVTNGVDLVMVLNSAFEVTNNPPAIVYVDPNEGKAGQSLTVDISGDYTSFMQASGTNVVSLVKAGSPTIAASSITVFGNTYLSAMFDIPASATLGLYGVKITNAIDGNVQLTNGFTIKHAPELTNVTPASGKQGQTLTVDITGAYAIDFMQASQTVWLQDDASSGYISATQVIAKNTNTTSATFSIPNNALITKWDVYLEQYNWNGYEKIKLAKGFEILKGDNGIAENSNALSALTIYPNPFTENALLSYSLTRDGVVDVSLYNMLGQKIKTYINTTQHIGAHQVIVSETDITPGLYYITIKVGANSLQTIKMIKQ